MLLTCPYPALLVDTFTTARGRLMLGLMLLSFTPDSDTPLTDTPDLDTLVLDTLLQLWLLLLLLLLLLLPPLLSECRSGNRRSAQPCPRCGPHTPGNCPLQSYRS